MPFSGSSSPTRPLRLWTFSEDRLCLSTSAVLWALFPFGALFTAVGCLLIVQMVRVVLARFGIVLPLPQQPPVANGPFWQVLFGAVGVMVFGGIFLVAGATMLQSLSVTFDRDRQRVTVRTGWMGLRIERKPLAAFQRVRVLSSTHAFSYIGRLSGRMCYYDIVLAGETAPPLVVGIVTQSPELAQQVVDQVCDFTGLQKE